MRTTYIRALLLALGLLALQAAVAAGGGVRYKWRDAKGDLHFGDALPADAAKYGYDVVNAQGIVVKHVDRAKTPAEQAADKASQARALAAKQTEETRERSDRQMLAAYPTEDDLKRAQQQQIDMLGQNINAAQISLNSQERSLADLLGHAADIERSGKPVPATLAKEIATVRRQIEGQRAYIARKETERTNSAARFQGDLAHYRELQQKVKEQR